MTARSLVSKKTGGGKRQATSGINDGISRGVISETGIKQRKLINGEENQHQAWRYLAELA